MFDEQTFMLNQFSSEELMTMEEGLKERIVEAEGAKEKGETLATTNKSSSSQDRDEGPSDPNATPSVSPFETSTPTIDKKKLLLHLWHQNLH